MTSNQTAERAAVIAAYQSAHAEAYGATALERDGRGGKATEAQLQAELRAEAAQEALFDAIGEDAWDRIVAHSVEQRMDADDFARLSVAEILKIAGV